MTTTGPPIRFVEVARAEDLPPGTVRAVEVDGRPLALVNVDGKLFALDGTCPHAGGPLGEGEVTGRDSLQCPWHGAVFELRSGAVLEGPAAGSVRSYEVKVEDGSVWVAVEVTDAGGARRPGAGDTAGRPARQGRRAPPPPTGRPPPGEANGGTTEEGLDPDDPRTARRERLARLRATRDQQTTGAEGGTAGGPAGDRPVGRRGGQGQWAFGYYEPLNEAERVKRDQDGLDVYERIVSVHTHPGFASIPKDDLATRYRWYGLYTQRPEEDGFFMLRVRVPGGVLTAEQVEAVGRISQRFGRDVCDVTDRQNFQFHWICIDDVPEIWARLGAVGLTTRQTCGDVTRNILGCPLAGVAATELLDATPSVLAVERRLTGTKEFSIPANTRSPSPAAGSSARPTR